MHVHLEFCDYNNKTHKREIHKKERERERERERDDYSVLQYLLASRISINKNNKNIQTTNQISKIQQLCATGYE